MNNRPWMILLVEDDEDDYVLTRQMLAEARGSEFNLTWVTGVDMALDYLATASADAVLVDYYLGSQTGLELIREAGLRGYKAPMILLTGRGNYDVDLEAMQSGAADYLVKSEVTAPLLERTIRYAIERKATEEALEQRIQERTGELALANQELRQEIGERQRAEQALRSSNALLEGLFESAPDAILLINSLGCIERANRQTYTLFGYSPEELAGKPLNLLIPDRKQPSHPQNVQEYFGHPDGPARPMVGVVELFGRRHNGREIPVDVTLSPLKLEDGDFLICVVRDLTQRKHSEQALRERDKLIQTAVTGSPLALFVIRKDGDIQLSLGRGSAALGRPHEEAAGRSIFQVAQDSPDIIVNFNRALAGETFNTTQAVDGLVFEARYTPLHNEKGETTGVAGVAMDVTERLMAEEALHKSEARFRTIFEESGIGIELLDLEGSILACNPALQEILGYTEAELLGSRRSDYSDPADVAADLELFEKLSRGDLDRYNLEKRFRRRDDSRVWARLIVSLVRDDAGAPQFAIAMIENITERKQIEAELAEVQRRLLESGESERLHLAQELHDGPMQTLYGLTYQMRALQNEGMEPAASDSLDGVQASMIGVVQVLRQICGELRPPSLVPFGLEKAIRSHAETFQHEHPEMEIHLELAPDGLEVPEGLRLAMFRIYQASLANVLRHAHAPQVWVRFLMDAEEFILEVEDNGQGFVVPERWVDFARQGHLGLAGAFERAEAAGGKLVVTSSPGAGTLIQAIIPRQEEIA